MASAPLQGASRVAALGPPFTAGRQVVQSRLLPGATVRIDSTHTMRLLQNEKRLQILGHSLCFFQRSHLLRKPTPLRSAARPPRFVALDF